MKEVQETNTIIPKKINSFSIVGIGTSAGGLEALKIFFDNLPQDFNHAIVIVQHLSPDYKSLMADLLSRNTDLPIHEVIEGAVIKAGHVYLIPPKKNMTISNGVLHLTDKPTGFDLNLPIDIFFKSLAHDQKDSSIGIVLSGTGSDGTRGMRVIKEFGGMLMVQKPNDAKFDGMPNSAIATGLVDYILPVSEIPKELVNFIKHPKSLTNFEEDKDFVFKKDFTRIISLVQRKTNIDFSDYKLPTLARRVIRRMSVNKFQTIRDYLYYVTNNESELEILYREFLIGVTKFFRDGVAFDLIEQEIIPEIFKNKSKNEKVKIWSVGCSSGEEAYSLAILIKEYMDKNDITIDVKIFATDLNKEVIQKANKGSFTESIVADISFEHLSKYFIKKDDLYIISPAIRRMIIFSQHNAAQDPPLTKMDLISCRNMLIYLEPSLQQKILGSFHYALKPNKFLFLGPSETIGKFSASFKTISRKWRIYKNMVPTKTMNLAYLNNSFSESRLSTKTNINKQSLRDKQLAETLSETLLEETGAASVYVDKDFELISADGNFKDFFEFPEKKFRSFSIFKILPQSISIALSTALRKAEKELQKVVYKDILITDKNNNIKSLTLIVKPIKTPSSSLHSIYLILFLLDQDDFKQKNLPQANTIIKGRSQDVNELNVERVALLEQELSDTKANLQSLVEEIETSNEELQATNEELLASNEELQSTNEELQSVNEELHTVNSEYQEKMEEIAAVNSDLENLIDSTEIGTIFLDRKLNIRKFTPSVKQFFNIIQSDIGRPISHFNFTFSEDEDQSFINTLNEVLQTGKSFEKETLRGTSKWYLKRLNPFFNSSREIEGVVISFVDITPLKTLKNEMDKKNVFLQKIIDIIPNVLYIFNQQTKINEYVNKDLYKYLGYTEKELQDLKDNVMPALVHPKDLENTKIHFNNIKNSKEGEILEFEYRIKHKDGKYRWFLSQDTIFQKIEGTKFIKHIGIATDITKVKNYQNKLKEVNENLESKVLERTKDLELAKEKFRKLYDIAPDMFASVDPKDGTIIECNETFLEKTGYSRKEIIGSNVINLYHKDFQKKAENISNDLIKTGNVKNKELKINKKNGGYIDVNVNITSVTNDDGTILYNSSSWRDITDLKNMMSELEDLTYASTHDLKAPINNISSYLTLLKENPAINDESSLESIRWIESNIKNATNTLENLMSVAKARTLVLTNLEELNIEEIFIDSLTNFNAIIDKLNIKIDYNFKQCKTVYFSNTHLKSMLENMLNNAIMYKSPERPLEILVTSFKTKNFDCISITDNGIGIDLEEHLPHVFGLFKRAVDDQKGSGLALYLIRKILEKTGGKIEVESELGKGSTFTLYFKN